MRYLVLLLLVALLAAGAWYVLAGRDASDDGTGAIDRTNADESAEDLVMLRGRGVEEIPDGGTVGAESPAPDAEPAALDGLYVLRGELVGFDPTRPGDARVRVLPVADPFVVRDAECVACVAGSDGRFTVDLTALFARTSDLTHIEILVDHPAYVQGKERMDVTTVRAAGRGEIGAKIPLRPGLALFGVVVGRDGRPLAQVDVALFKSGPDGPVVEHVKPVLPVARDQTDVEGRYRLRVAAPGTYLAAAASTGMQPAGVRATLTAETELGLPPLVLDPGLTVEGRVLYDGAPVSEAQAEVYLGGAAGPLPLDMGPRVVRWAPGDALRAVDFADTDARGRFRLEGLSPVLYSVNVAGVSIAGFACICPLVTDVLSLEVEAPARDVVFEIAGAALELRVMCDDSPVAEAHVQFATPGASCGGLTDAEGMLRVLLAAGQAYTLFADGDRYEHLQLAIRAGAAGTTRTHEVELRVAAPKPSLLVTFSGPNADALSRVWIQLRNLAGAEPASQEAPLPAASFEPSTVRVRPGAFRLEGLEPGHYRMTTRPGGGRWGDAGYYLQDEREIRIPPVGEAQLTIPLVAGGRLRIAARNDAGMLLNAACVIRNVVGEALDVLFSTRNEVTAMTRGASLGDMSPATVRPPLPPGTYTVELSKDGYASQTLAVEVREGETTNVDVKLLPR